MMMNCIINVALGWFVTQCRWFGRSVLLRNMTLTASVRACVVGAELVGDNTR